MSPAAEDNLSLDPSPDAWGIHETWLDAQDHVQHVAPAELARLRQVIGTPPPDLDTTSPLVVRRGDRVDDDGVAVCEDGTTRRLGPAVPSDFPFGYHRLHRDDGTERALIVSPGRCWLPEDRRAWGWTVQLYAARSSRSWGIGDLRDLRYLREWAQRCGAGFLLINPLHAVAPTFPQEASPYLPTSRRFRNPIYLCVETVDGFQDLASAARTSFEERRVELNTADLIDRDAIWRLKREALKAAYDAWRSGADQQNLDDFATWRTRQGDGLHDFAVWTVLAMDYGFDWRIWPAELHDPRRTHVAELAAARAGEVDFQAWLQWQLERQLQEAGAGFNVIQDLPIGVDGGGADAWAWQDVLASGVTVGAPPDLFSARGQNWGSPPVIPWQVRAADYQPFIDSVRATMTGAGGLRIDHVMGLFRIWWVPPEGRPVDGAYVRYPSDDLLDIVALESHRQQAIVVGEDLGTVEAGVRESLAERAILSYRLLWFERQEPPAWPPSSMAAITTHDLPTIAGLWTGDDVEDQLRYGDDDADALEERRQVLLEPLLRAVGRDDVSVDEAIVEAHRYLATAPSVLLSATLDDAVAAARRPNIPGASERENWCLPLPVLIDELDQIELPARIAEVFGRALAAAPRSRVGHRLRGSPASVEPEAPTGHARRGPCAG